MNGLLNPTKMRKISLHYRSALAIRFVSPSFLFLAVAPIFLFSLCEVKNAADKVCMAY
jgi:hypothetical protein